MADRDDVHLALVGVDAIDDSEITAADGAVTSELEVQLATEDEGRRSLRAVDELDDGSGHLLGQARQVPLRGRRPRDGERRRSQLRRMRASASSLESTSDCPRSISASLSRIRA